MNLIMKKVGIILFCLVLTLLVVLTVCGEQNTALAKEFKIGIFGGTVSQGEEEYRAAENMVAKYGEDMIIHMTYPDKFVQEQETIITNLTAMASDPLVKALVIVQAVSGTSPAIDKIKELRPDILIIAGVPGEDPAVIAKRADVVLNIDEIGMGITMMEQAQKMGAKTFVHYSFPRHMSYEILIQQLANLKKTAKRLGIKFVYENAPDPTGDAGVPGTQMFLMEDVPRKVKEYGKDTAIHGTNCAMQEALIRQVIKYGAIYPVQCCPSPYHGYPGALGIEIPEDKKGDVPWIIEAIDQKIVELGAAGRLGSWPVPSNMAFIEAGVKYAIEYIEGRTDGKLDEVKMESILGEITGGEIDLVPLGNLDNYLLFQAPYITFGVNN